MFKEDGLQRMGIEDTGFQPPKLSGARIAVCPQKNKEAGEWGMIYFFYIYQHLVLPLSWRNCSEGILFLNNYLTIKYI